MGLYHFSHQHPLMLISEVPIKVGTDQKVVSCYGCRKPILSSSVAYSCSDCNYFLHEKCANLPMEIKHPKHEQHPLKLFRKPPYTSLVAGCDVCGIGDWEWFTYNCSVCKFDVHVECVLDERTVKHESHPHSLTVVHKKSSFLCDACFTKDEDYSLFCSTCEFWIHKTCASLPTTIEHRDHDHPLLLNYFFPYENRSFNYDCDICRQQVHEDKWIYSCKKCRYFAHLKCVTSDQLQSSRSDVIADDPETIIRFPLTTEASINLSSRVLNEVNLAGTENVPEIKHFSHDHPLVLFGDQINNVVMEDKEVMCNCCIRPITSAPFYGCSQCSYFLHKSCTKLPHELQHPFHPDHLLELSAPQSCVEIRLCTICIRYTNGFSYWCKTCNYHLDISCAFFAKIIKHDSHKHPLHKNDEYNNYPKCDSCGSFCHYLKVRFSCDPCDFHLDANCAGLPGTFKHDWDDHPLILSYPPYSDHPDRFYCEICEEEMYPKNWAYRSSNGIHFYHTKCVIPYDPYSKMKFGDTLAVEHHSHPLTLVQKSKNKSPSLCDMCRLDSKGIPIVECAPCNFVICNKCIRSILHIKK